MLAIEAVIKSNRKGQCYIELFDETKEESLEMCVAISDYVQKIKKMALKHGAEVEVIWSSDDKVTQKQIDEVHMHIMICEAEVESGKNKQMEG